MDSSLIWAIAKEPRTRIAVATIAGSAPLVFGGLVWVSTLSFYAQMIVGSIMGIATMASFHFLGVHRSHKRLRTAVTTAQMSSLDLGVLRRMLPGPAVPSWIQNITDFEKATWINRELEEVWPYVDEAASEMLKTQLQPILDEYKFGPIQKISIKSATLGKIGPMIGGLRVTPGGTDEVMIEVEADWRHGRDQNIVLHVQTLGPDFTVQIKDIMFYGIFRIVLKPLTDILPCFGAAVTSLREPPLIDFRTKFLGGDALQLPGVDSMIDDIIRAAVTDLLVWPSRMIFPILPGDYSFLELKPVGYLEVHVIEGKKLLNKEILGKSDPFAYVFVRQKNDLMQRTATKSNTSNPTWDEHFILDVEDPIVQTLTVKVMDSDKLDAADYIGCAEVPIKELEQNVAKDMWLKLLKDPKKPLNENEKNRGDIHIVVCYKPYKAGVDAEPDAMLPSVPEGMGVKKEELKEEKEGKKEEEEREGKEKEAVKQDSVAAE